MPYYKKLVLNRIKAASAIRFIRQIKQSIKNYYSWDVCCV